MVEEINERRRKALLTLGSGIVLGATMPFSGSSYALEDIASLLDGSKIVNYTEKVAVPSQREIECLIKRDILGAITLKYRIPENDKNLRGGMILTLKPNLTDLLVRVEQEKENKLFHFYDLSENGRRFYKEYIYDFNKQEVEYDEPERKVEALTAPRLIGEFLNGGVWDNNFHFWGKRKSGQPRVHSLSLNTTEQDSTVFVEGNIESDKPKIKKIEAILVRLNKSQRLIPVAIDVDYSVRIINTPFKDFYKDMTLRGVLTDKLDDEMFRKPI